MNEYTYIHAYIHTDRQTDRQADIRTYIHTYIHRESEEEKVIFKINSLHCLEGIYHSPSHVFVITGNILITAIRLARYHLPLASNNTLMTDSMYLGTIQICRNLNEHGYLISTTSVI